MDLSDSTLGLERLTPELAIFRQQWRPLARQLTGLKTPYVLGINGAQGSGKSTLARYLQAELGQTFGLQVAVLSLDDLYYPQSHRRWLATQVHPLLATRGVPGTHDISLGLELIRRFRTGQELSLPRFDKSKDDRATEGEWLEGPADILIVEGWCLGAESQTEAELVLPINELEEREDTDGVWRSYVNNCLATDYQRFFTALDELWVLQAPDWQSVLHWRAEQEQKLRQTRGKGMDAQQLARFMLHYQRLTCHQLENPPVAATRIFQLDSRRRVQTVTGRAAHDWQI